MDGLESPYEDRSHIDHIMLMLVPHKDSEAMSW